MFRHFCALSSHFAWVAIGANFTQRRDTSSTISESRASGEPNSRDTRQAFFLPAGAASHSA